MSSSNITISGNIQNNIDTINWIVILISRWATPVIFLFGLISNILNIYVFTRVSLRRNPCSMYFLSSAIAALTYTLINLPLRTLQYGYNIDPTSYLLSFCKIKYFFTFTWRALILWFLVLACVDRFLHSSSNANLRRWSSFKTAFRTIPLTFLLVHMAYLHVAIFYQIRSTPPSCLSENGFYEIFVGIWHLIAYGIGPPFLMFIFSLLTILHVRYRRIVPVTIQLNQTNRKSNKDRHLLRMLFTQCVFIGSTTMAYGILQLYISLSSAQPKDRLRLAVENLVIVLVGNISATGHSTTFFVFTLASKMFREQLLCQRRQRV